MANWIWVVGALTTALSPPLSAETVAPIPCELHVWPSQGLSSMRARAHDNFQSGLGDGMGAHLFKPILASPDARYLGSNDKFATEHAAPSEQGPLSTSRQIELLTGIDLPKLLHLPNYGVVFHSASAGMADVRSSNSLLRAGPNCHAELVLADLTYARVYAHGHNLKTFIALRLFNASGTMTLRLGLPLEARLTVSADPAKRTEQAFVGDLESAFQNNVLTFGSKASSSR